MTGFERVRQVKINRKCERYPNKIQNQFHKSCINKQYQSHKAEKKKKNRPLNTKKIFTFSSWG